MVDRKKLVHDVENFYVEIVECESGHVERRMGPHDEKTADRIDRGANFNLDHERFYTRVVSEPESCADCNASGVTGPELATCPTCKGMGRVPPAPPPRRGK